jgi:cbb3-type cytochrome oxidase subunit 1
LRFWTPEVGRWELVWAHALLVGWFLMMASGVAYHVLSRWTGARWRSVRRVRLHLFIAAGAAPAMVLALALDLERLFAVAGTLQAAAVALFIWNVAPLALRLPRVSRYAVIAAVTFLALGVSLGASAALDPTNHTRLRFSHAEINLLGWAGLLVCGMGYYLFPRFAGQPLRWPRIAPVQLALHAAGVVLSAGAWWWYLAVDERAQPLISLGALCVAASLAAFAGIIALTFQHTGRVVTQTVTLHPRRSTPPR